MGYKALYRKFRPKTFNDVKGQDAIVTTLKNQIKSGMLSHAYLFCGTRGTGKTTIAKILATAVNCENLEDGEPCGECESCKSISQGNSINVIEIDAASNNGVDDIRGIREEIEYPPTVGKYKVYIIDEVHMLSNAAFNALLKTLEEPPSYVIFILATTEAQKIPDTILSRCQRYNFKRISVDVITNRLKALMEKENRDVEERALKYIARLGDGSMRDSLSLLDRCLAFYIDMPITYDMVLNCLGTLDSSASYSLLKEILNGNTAGVIENLSAMINDGREPPIILNDFIWYLRNILLVDAGDGIQDIINVSSENLELLKKQRKEIEPDIILRYIRELSQASDRMKMSTQKRILLDVSFIRLMKPEMENDNDALLNRIYLLEKKLEEQMDNIKRMPVPRSDDMTTQKEEASSELPKKKLEIAIPDDIKKIVTYYRDYIKGLDMLLKPCLDKSHVSMSKDNNLLIVLPDEISYQTVLKRKDYLEEFLSMKLGKKVSVEFSTMDSGKNFEEEYIDLEEYIKTDISVDNI